MLEELLQHMTPTTVAAMIADLSNVDHGTSRDITRMIAVTEQYLESLVGASEANDLVEIAKAGS